MAELYEKPKLYANAPAGVTPISGDPDLDKVLAELPPEEREEAMRKITAPPTGEEIARAMMEKNSNGEMFNMSLEQYRLLKAHNKNKEVDIISTFGQAAGGIYDEMMKAAESVVNNPADALAKVTPSLIEAFAQGTRNLYGMAAQSADPTSVMFRMKNALAANGSDEEAEYRQFMEAQQFNIHSMNLMSGKETLIMDKDVINPEMTQVMSYVADPTLFVPFGGIAAKGARIIGMGEGLAKASARASAIRNKVLGGTLKWGVGAPIEFLGNATRNTIDYGLERSATAFEFATGMPAAEAQATARMYGLNSVAGSLAGQTVPLPIVGNVAGAMVGATTAQGVGEAIGMLGEQMIKQQKHGRGVLSYAGQALRDSEKAGVQLSAHAKGLLRVIDMADPLFVYGADIAEGAGTGMVIGGGLGYLAGGEEGMASGAGAGFALGAVGAGLGSVTADVTNNRLYDRIAIQRKMVIEGLKGTDDAKASAFEAYVKAAESTGDRRYMAEVDGMIAGIDLMSPNSKWNIRTEAEHTAWLQSLKIDPKTGRLVEETAILPQFGTDRKQRASALSFLSMVSDNFSGLPENLLQHIDTLPEDHAMRKHWARLSDDVKQAVLAEVKQMGNIEYRKKFGVQEISKSVDNVNSNNFKDWINRNYEYFDPSNPENNLAEIEKKLEIAGKDGNKKLVLELRERQSHIKEVRDSYNAWVNEQNDAVKSAADAHMQEVWKNRANRPVAEVINPRKKVSSGRKPSEYYGNINYAEAHTARINALFDSGNPTQARERINMLLKEETVNGKLTERGKALKDKLATEGYFDKDGNMRPSRLKDVELTENEYRNVAGFVLRRDSTGQVEVNLNINKMGKVTGLHELFHAIMLDSPMKDEFIDRLSTKLLGKFDANGKRLEGASVDTNQIKKFFQRYIDSKYRNDPQERANEIKRLERAIEEYEQRGDQNKVNRTMESTLEHMVEEFGAFYFPKFIQDKPVDYLFRGGELGAMREMFQSVKFGWLDFWRSKIGSANPEFNADAIQGNKISQVFGKEGQPRYKNKALDLFMGDFVKATAMANRNGNFDLSRLSPEGQKTFVRNNGIRGYGTIDKDGKLVRLNRRTALREEMRVGKEIYKVIAGLDPKLRQGLTLDGEGNFSGRVSPELADALVASGHIERAWVDKLLRAYDIIDGKESNVIEFGYLGRTAQIGDYAWPRLVGSDVPFKNRTAILLDVDFKVGKDGRMTALYHTLDHAVIEGRANAIWSDPAIRSLWDGNRAAMEADFFRYLSNASLPSEHPSRVPSAKLLEDGTGKGAMRRNALHQMLGMAKLDGDVYLNKPIAEIPLGIRHSVTTFNIDGVSGMRVRQGARYDYNHRNAFRDLSRNFMPSELTSEKTANGEVLKHASGYKFIKTPNGKVNAYINSGKKIGTFDSIEKATQVAGAVYQKFYDTVSETGRKIESQQVANQRKFMIAEEETRLNSNGRQGIFGTEQVSDFTKGTKIVKQTQQEFLTQRVLELLRPENKERLDSLIEQGWSKYREIYEIEQVLNKEKEQLSLDMDELNRREKAYIDVIVHSIGLKGTPDEALGVAYGNMYQKKKAVNDRLIQIAKDLDSKGVNERSYYAAKFAYESIKKGERNIPMIEEFIGNIHKDLFNQNFNTGEPVSFVAVHGTPNKELLYTKTYDASRLGENTGSASARKATFFAGSDTTAITYVGNPLEKNWIFSEDWAYPSDTNRIRRSIERNYTNGVEVADSVIPMIENALDRIAEFDTTRGVVNELDRILSEKAVTNPDDFEAHPSARVLAKSSVGDAFREWILDYQTRMRDADVSFGSRDVYWKDAGRTPHILRNIVRMDNPFVYEYTRDTFRDVSFNDAITQAQQNGHDGVIFKNIRDGGGTDIIYALIAEDPNQKVMVIDTSADKDAVSRGYDENGEKILNGRELNLQMMPTEGEDIYAGGRTYNQNSKKWKSGFIGLWAEENPERLKGYNIEFFQKEAGAYRIRLQDNSVKGRTVDVGHITAVVSGDTATISTKIADEYQGNKLSYALYSEMAERLRAMGIRRVDGQIVNRDGVPIRVRERIIGDTRDYFSGKPIDQIEGAIRIREKQEQFGNMAGVDVYNTLDPKARYMMAEDIGSPQNVTEVHEWLNEVRNKGGDYTAVPMSESIKQTFGNLEAFKKARKEDMLTALEKAMQYGSQQEKDLLESVKSGKTPIKDAVDWIKKNGDFYTYNAELKDIRDERANLAKAVLRAMGEMRKISDKDGRRYNTEGEREHRNTMRQMPEEGDGYRGTHKAPSGENGEGSLDAMDRTYPEDIYSSNGARYYGTRDKSDAEMISIIHKMRGKPDELVTVYRAVPKGTKGEINAGDWVTPSKAYAQLHGGRWEEGMRIIEKKVPAGELFTEGNSIYEFGWSPKKKSMMPEEGGRTYTQKQMDNEFIGRWSEEVPDLKKGLKLYYGKIPSGMGMEGITLRDKKGDVVANIKFERFGDEVSIEKSDVVPKHQGKGYGYLVYSELLERLRSEGVKTVSGMVIDNAERPIKIRKRLIDVENRRIGQKDNTRILDARYDEEGNKQIDVESYLKQKARYMMAEGDEPIRLSGKKKVIELNGVKYSQSDLDSIAKTGYLSGEGNREYNVDSKQWTNGFIGAYAENNPILTKGVRLSMKNWDNRSDAYGKRSIELREGKKLIGRIDYEVKKGAGGKWMLYDPAVMVEPAYRKRGYSNLLYSEMAERARYLGAEDFLQRIENKDAIPMYSQINTFGFGESKLIDSGTGKSHQPTKENFDKLLYPEVEIQGKNGETEIVRGEEPWVHSWSKIFKDRHYQPAESEKAPVNWVKESFDKEGYNAEIIWMTPERFLNLAAPLGERANSIGARKRIEELKKTLQRKGGDMDMPYFSMKRNKNGELQVRSHEGRHRAIALKELYGDKKIPVVLTMDEIMKLENRGDFDFSEEGRIYGLKPEAERKKGTVSKEFKSLENTPFLNEEGTGKFQPAEGWRDWQSERTSVGSVIKNTAGYVIMVQKGKFKVYNPYKAIVGIYDSEEQAKRRVQKDEPRG